METNNERSESQVYSAFFLVHVVSLGNNIRSFVEKLPMEFQPKYELIQFMMRGTKLL